MMDVGQIVLGLVCIAGFVAIWVVPVAWAVRDAQQRGQGGGLIMLLFWLLGPMSALVWIAMRPAGRMVERAPVEYTTADDALAAAARLDQLGEWNAAIALYESVLQRWPEQQVYATTCLQQIRQKQQRA